MTGTIYKGAGGTTYTLAARIGGGGEGEVYAVKEDSSLVLKVYKEAPGADKAEKLRHMTTLVNDELQRFAAWPLDVVRDSHGRVHGFTMRKLQGYLPLHMLFTPMDRKKLFPDKGYNFLAHVARNLAVAFHKIHQAGIVVGDVNEANLLVSATGMVAFIDCDSFQVKNGQRYHFCEVGMMRYTPPELLRRGSFDHVVRTINTDAFSLATLIFQLLFLGRAPFTGINPGKQEIDEEMAIRNHDFAYSLRNGNKRLFPAKNSLELGAMPAPIADAFHLAFESGGERPTPLLWATELGAFIKDLIACSVSKLHFYPNKMVRCPWCTFKREANIYYFLDDINTNTPPQLTNIEHFINGFRLEQLNLPRLNGTFAYPGLKARKIPARFYRYRYLNLAAVIIVLILLVVFAAKAAFYGAIIPLGIALVRLVLPARGKLKRELTTRQQILKKVSSPFNQVIKQYNYPPALKLYNEAANRLKDNIAALRNLPAGFTQLKKNIEEKHYQLKYMQYLHHFDVQDHSIPGFGPAKKKMILDRGIRTAADVAKLKQVKIAGIGPKNQQVLFDWQRQVGTGFSYQPEIDTIRHELQLGAEGLAQRRKKLENEIRKEYATLTNIHSGIRVTQQQLEVKYQQMLPVVAQAQLDLDAFENLVNWRFFKWWT
jgi:DNA-binding helix-hairpin-helix protein with protein kinase domain